MRTIQRNSAIRDLARWFLDQFEQDWNVDGKPGYLFDFKYKVQRRIFAKLWIRARTMALVNHDRFLLLDDGAGFNREDIQQGNPPQIAKVFD